MSLESESITIHLFDHEPCRKRRSFKKTNRRRRLNILSFNGGSQDDSSDIQIGWKYDTGMGIFQKLTINFQKT